MCLYFSPMEAGNEDGFSSGARPTGNARVEEQTSIFCPRCPVTQMICCWVVQRRIPQERALNYLIVVWYEVKRW